MARSFVRILATSVVLAAAAPAFAQSPDPVIVQGATHFLPPATPEPRAVSGYGEGLAIGVSGALGTYFAPATLDITRYGQGNSWMGEARVGWYIHRSASLSLAYNYMTTTSDRGVLQVQRPGVAYRFHPTRYVWGQAELDFMRAPFTSYDMNGISGVAYGVSLQLSADLVLWTTSTFIVEAEVTGSSQIFQTSDGTFGVPFTFGLAVDYL